MEDPLLFRQRFLQAPGRLAQRRERRWIRRLVGAAIVLTAIIAGLVHSRGESVGLVTMAVGRALAGLLLLGMAGLIVGFVLTVLTVIVYNMLLRGRTSLLDVDFIDEIPLIFVVVGGLFGVFWALTWPVILGLAGWGLVALVGVESVLKPPNRRADSP
jgi:hypothetical protein